MLSYLCGGVHKAFFLMITNMKELSTTLFYI